MTMSSPLLNKRLEAATTDMFEKLDSGFYRLRPGVAENCRRALRDYERGLREVRSAHFPHMTKREFEKIVR